MFADPIFFSRILMDVKVVDGKEFPYCFALYEQNNCNIIQAASRRH